MVLLKYDDDVRYGDVKTELVSSPVIPRRSRDVIELYDVRDVAEVSGSCNDVILFKYGVDENRLLSRLDGDSGAVTSLATLPTNDNDGKSVT